MTKSIGSNILGHVGWAGASWSGSDPSSRPNGGNHLKGGADMWHHLPERAWMIDVQSDELKSRWLDGAETYGDKFHGLPLEQVSQELIDGLFYAYVAERQIAEAFRFLNRMVNELDTKGHVTLTTMNMVRAFCDDYATRSAMGSCAQGTKQADPAPYSPIKSEIGIPPEAAAKSDEWMERWEQESPVAAIPKDTSAAEEVYVEGRRLRQSPPRDDREGRRYFIEKYLIPSMEEETRQLRERLLDKLVEIEGTDEEKEALR